MKEFKPEVLLDEIDTAVNAELNENKDYSPKEIYYLLLKLVEEAEKLGYTNCKLRFSSEMVPYEDYLDSPQVTVVGSRLENSEEQARRLDRAFTERYAALKGITFFEATTILDLQKRGKL